MNIKFIKYKSSFILLGLLFCFCRGYAQNRKVIGRIVDDETQKGLGNAHVIVRGTSNGTSTNAMGYFELTVDPSKYWILVVSHVGYKTSDIEIPNEDRFKFALKKGYTSLGRIELANYPVKSTGRKSKRLATEKKTPNRKGDEVFTVVESYVEFPGGTQTFLDNLGNAISSDVGSLRKDVRLTFTVSDSGKVSDFILHDSLPAMETAIGNFFSKMPPCKPATQRGKLVPQQYELIIGSLTNVNEFYEFMQKKLRYPLQARRMGIEGLIWSEFEVTTAGKMAMARVIKGIGAGCDEEVVAALKAVPPDILSGMSDSAGPRIFILPVGFGLDGPVRGPDMSHGSGVITLRKIDVLVFGSPPPNR